MNFITRFFIYAPFVLFVVLAAGVSFFWFAEARALSGHLDRLNGRPAMPGVTLRFSSKKIEGFPFRLDAIFRHFDIEVATSHGPSHWQSEDFAFHRLTYDAGKTLFEAAGRQSLSWTDEMGVSHSTSFSAGSLHASSHESDGRLQRFDLVGAAIEAPTLSAALVSFHERRSRNNAIELFLETYGVRGRSLSRVPLGGEIEHFRASGRAVPELALAALEEGRDDWPHALRVAENAAGKLAIDSFEIAFGPLHASGGGTLNLDTAARPQGSLRLSFEQSDALMGRIRSANDQGVAAALLSNSQKAGSTGASIVVTAGDGVITVGSRRIGSLEPVF